MSDESPHEDSSLEEAPQQEVKIINVEKQDVEANISAPFTSPSQKLHSQSSKRPVEKKISDPPSRKKQSLDSAKKGSSSRVPAAPSASQ